MQPLNLAVIKDSSEIAKVLLDAGAKVDGGIFKPITIILINISFVLLLFHDRNESNDTQFFLTNFFLFCLILLFWFCFLLLIYAFCLVRR